MLRLTIVVVLALIAVGLLVSGDAPVRGASAGAVETLAGCTAHSLPRSDDYSSNAVTLTFTLNFFGSNYSSLYVNNNGNVTFDSAFPDSSLFGNLSSRVIVAPFFADVDTRPAASGVVTYGNATFEGHSAFCVNWINVGYYDQETNKLDSFQLLLVSRPDRGVGDFDMILNYDRLTWETGDSFASGGTNGLGGSSAIAGYSNGGNTTYQLPGSGQNGALLDSSPTGLIHHSFNSTVPGRWIFSTHNGVLDSDGDGVSDGADNCPNWYNPTQALPSWQVPTGDSDCDAFPDSVAAGTRAPESFVGTDPTRHCASTPTANDEPLPDAWPMDFNDDQMAGLADVTTFSPHFGAHASDPPGTVPSYGARWDLDGDGRIGLGDVTQFSSFFGKRCA